MEPRPVVAFHVTIHIFLKEMRPVNRLTKIAVLLVVLPMVVGSPAGWLAQPAGAEKAPKRPTPRRWRRLQATA